MLVDAYSIGCRNQNNFHLLMLANRYVQELPKPIVPDISAQFVDIQLGVIPYDHRKTQTIPTTTTTTTTASHHSIGIAFVVFSSNVILHKHM